MIEKQWKVGERKSNVQVDVESSPSLFGHHSPLLYSSLLLPTVPYVGYHRLEAVKWPSPVVA
jgi:hypothetical protein